MALDGNWTSDRLSLGETRADIRQKGGHPKIVGVGAQPERHAAGHFAAQRHGPGLERLCGGQHLKGVLDQLRTRGGQLHAARHPVKEPDAKLLFQSLYMR